MTESPEPPTLCDQCQVSLVERTVTHEVLLGQERFDIDDVPALECPQCGLRWISPETKETIDRIVQENS